MFVKSKKITCLVLVLFSAFVIMSGCKKEIATGDTVKIEIILKNSVTSYEKTHEIQTDLKKLGDILAEEEFVTMKNSEFGRYITAVNGYEPDFAKEEWWQVYVNGESSSVGVDMVEVKEGDKIELVLTVGFDNM